MTPKDKAQELVDRYYFLYGDGYLGSMHKQCALIAVDELIKEQEIWKKTVKNNIGFEEKTTYWQQVKQEIENL